MGVMRPELVMKSIVPVVMAGVLGIYGLIVSVIIATNIHPTGYTLFQGYAHLGSGLTTGLAGLAAGMAIGIIGDAGVRANAQQPKLFTGMLLMLIFAEALALYGLIVGIMAKGLMRTLGTPAELRVRFDQGYKFVISCQRDAGVEAQADDFVRKLMPEIKEKDAINGVRTYELPKSGVKMSTLFREMESNKEALKIKDWGLSHTTLEEVFLQIVADVASTTGSASKAPTAVAMA